MLKVLFTLTGLAVAANGLLINEIIQDQHTSAMRTAANQYTWTGAVNAGFEVGFENAPAWDWSFRVMVDGNEYIEDTGITHTDCMDALTNRKFFTDETGVEKAIPAIAGRACVKGAF